MKRSIDDLGEKLETKKPVFLQKAEFEEQKRCQEQQPQSSNPNSSKKPKTEEEVESINTMKRSIKEEVESINTMKRSIKEEVESINTESNPDGITEMQAKKRKTEEEVESIKEEYFRRKNWVLKMESFITFACPCGRGDVVERTAQTSENYGRVYYACPDSKPKNKIKKYGCGFFEWKDEHESNSDSSGSSSPSSSSSELSGYGGPSHENPECSKCKLLAMEKKILQAALDMERHPENHTSRSVAVVYELLNDMKN